MPCSVLRFARTFFLHTLSTFPACRADFYIPHSCFVYIAHVAILIWAPRYRDDRPAQVCSATGERFTTGRNGAVVPCGGGQMPEFLADTGGAGGFDSDSSIVHNNAKLDAALAQDIPWARVCAHVGTRTGRQCWQRWLQIRETARQAFSSF